ncbi:MAG: PorV/PorQ family protein [Balneolaceae bacterium]|nr:PorV/PorQ family protein [Balneolaceae bacterium]
MKKHLPGVFILLIASINLQAQDTGSGLDFLNIGPSPRLLSISEAGTAVLSGPSSMFTNPSLLAFEESNSVDVSYTLWISEVGNQFAAINFKQPRSAIALGIFSSKADEFEARNNPGPSAGTFSVSYLSLAGSAAYRLGPVSAGFTAQYLREEVFQFIANGYAFNLGASARIFQERVLMGVSLNNLGKMEELDTVSTPVPSSWNAGISADIVEFVTPGENDLPILISAYAAYSKPIQEQTTSDFASSDSKDGFFSLALSGEAASLFSLQAGYRFGPTERPVSFGLGLILDPVRINYAMVPFSTGFGTVHSFGLQYNF